MTIPTRPAPPPPQVRSSTNTAPLPTVGNNTSLEQLRLGLQSQQQHQKLTIKLPPPPERGCKTDEFSSFASKNNNTDLDAKTNSAITRKFPKARYAPATDWNFSPFDQITTPTINESCKKVPPPRPPPPKLLINGRQKINTCSSSVNKITNIFNRKKTISSTSYVKQQSIVRTCGVSSGKYFNSSKNASTIDSNTKESSRATSSAFTSSDLNDAWNANTTKITLAPTTTLTATSRNQQEAELISFDSPPSSPTFTQKSNSDCVSIDSFSSDSNFSSPQNGSVSQPESGFEDDFTAISRSRSTTSPLDPWEAFSTLTGRNGSNTHNPDNFYSSVAYIGTAPVRNFPQANAKEQDNPLCNGRSLMQPAPPISMPTIIKPKISQKPKAPRPPNGIGMSNRPNLPSSILSQGAATPPMMTTSKPSVSILDVISGKVDAIHLSNCPVDTNNSSHNEDAPFGIALYDFVGTEDGDLSFRENEKIYLLELVSEEWYRGRTRAGCEGIFPANYIEIKVPLSMKIPQATPSTSENSRAYCTNTNPSTTVEIPKVRCLYNFPADVEGDLELKENDMVTILYRINEDWLFGKINNRQGQFPANFLEYIPANIPFS